ncbi:hypothetical protein [Cerasicoccus frondis]|uniref:hypothetical protein n=1 Tax=Cerasicoccus frondis TaxID=490090 RepID=UPI002852C906|nr:hypothetical protein [Cerasicoccus frondis]
MLHTPINFAFAAMRQTLDPTARWLRYPSRRYAGPFGRVHCGDGQTGSFANWLGDSNQPRDAQLCPTHPLHDALCQPGQRSVDV